MQRFANAKLHIRILAIEILRLLSSRTNSLNEFPKIAKTRTNQEQTRKAFESSKSPHGLNASFSGVQVRFSSESSGGLVTTVSGLKHSSGGKVITLFGFLPFFESGMSHPLVDLVDGRTVIGGTDVVVAPLTQIFAVGPVD